MIEAIQAYLAQVEAQTGSTVALVAAVLLLTAIAMGVKGWRS